MYSGMNRIIATPYTLSACHCENGMPKNRGEVIVEVLQSKRGSGAARAIVKTTAEWEAKPDYVPGLGAILAYSDFSETTTETGEKKYIPGIKIGDGKTKIGDLMFAGANEAAEVLSVEEVEEILGDPVPPGPVPPEDILTHDEILEILDADEQGNTSNEAVSNDTPVEGDRNDILTDSEILAILDQSGD